MHRIYEVVISVKPEKRGNETNKRFLWVQMIAPAANNYMNFTGPLADLGKMLFGLVGIAFAIVLVRSGMKIAAQHREARVTLHEMAIVEEASRRLPPGLTDTCTSSRLAAYHPGLKSEMTTATGFGMSTV